MPSSGPCSAYADVEDVPDDAICGERDDDLLELCLQRAADALWEMLGNQFPGECSATVRPVRRSGCWEDFTRAGYYYYSSTDTTPIPLTPPVRSVESVKIDGDEVDDWYLIDGYLLARPTPWPTSQKLHLPSTEADTFEIVYTHGVDTPELLVAANVEMGVWFYETWVPAEGRVTADNVSRQGMSWSTSRDLADLRRNGPNLPAVAAAVGAYNPNGTRRPWGFYSPDVAWDLVVVTYPSEGS